MSAGRQAKQLVASLSESSEATHHDRPGLGMPSWNFKLKLERLCSLAVHAVTPAGPTQSEPERRHESAAITGMLPATARHGGWPGPEAAVPVARHSDSGSVSPYYGISKVGGAYSAYWK